MQTYVKNSHLPNLEKIDVHSDQGGITLVETLITLSILSFSALITAGAISASIPQRAIHQSAERMVSDLKRGRLYSKEINETVSVTVDENTYTITGIQLIRTLPPGVTISLNDDAGITFSPNFANLGGRILLTQGENRAVIFIHPITGKIDRVE